jgi:hypothetical protein
MARKPKIFNYEFVDGTVAIPSSYKAKCNITGEFVPIYHKNLIKIIENDYKNNFGLFVKTFKQKGAKKKQLEEAGYTGDKHSLNAYSDYLIICYKGCIDTLKDNYNKVSISKAKTEMSFLADCFYRHFNRDIKRFV